MAKNELFTVAGTTNHKGTIKVRFGNNLDSRIKCFIKGNTDVELVELPRQMTKLEALEHLTTLETFATGERREAIDEKITEKRAEARRAEKNRTLKVNAKAVAVPATTPVEA